MGTFKKLILLALVFGPGAVFASEEFMRSFQSPRVLFPSQNSDYMAVNPGRYPDWLHWLFQDVFSWRPMGIKAKGYATGCEPEKLYEALRSTTNVMEQAARIDDHKVRCGDSFQNGISWSWFNSLRIMSMELDIHKHSLFHRVVFNLPGGINLKGLLALKGDYKKRPFVVIRLGIYSNVEEFLPERYLLMHLFEQGLANVLVLENMSSADFIANNIRHSLGGFDEGVQNIQVAKILRNPEEPLSQLISSLHFMGISLGGHGVLFASLLNQYNNSGRLIQSFTGICPVVNLQQTLNSLVQPNILGVGADFWSSQRLEGLQKRDPILANYGWPDIFKLKPIFLPRAVDFITEQFEKNPPALGSVQLPPAPYSAKSFWQANNFWSVYRNISSPLLVMGTKDDIAVSPNENLYWLKEKSRAWNSQIGTVVFEKGFHCTLPVAYDWASMTSLFNGRIMAYDRAQVKIRETLVDISDAISAGDLEVLKSPRFSVKWIDDKKVQLQFSPSLESLKPNFTVQIPVDQFDFKFHRPLATAEKISVERWLNQNLQIKVLKDQGHIKARLQWPEVL